MEKRWHLSLNAPATLGFAAVCLAAMLAAQATGGASTYLLFMNYRAPLSDPLTYLRFFTHAFGHASWDHFYGNIVYILLLGPMLEEKYGSRDLVIIMAISAFVAGLANFILFPGQAVLGASGIVFTFILLSSATSFKQGEIPITLVVVAVIFLGQEIYDGLFVADNVSNLTHILGGLVGAGIGLANPKARA